MSGCKEVCGTLPGGTVNQNKLYNRELNKYQKMQSASHYMFFKRNMAVLNQNPNQSSNTAVGGNGDSVTSVEKFKDGSVRKGVDKKHGSYARYLAAKTARAGRCAPTTTNKTNFTNNINNTTVAAGKRFQIKNYLGFLRHYRCNADVQQQAKDLASA